MRMRGRITGKEKRDTEGLHGEDVINDIHGDSPKQESRGEGVTEDETTA